MTHYKQFEATVRSHPQRWTVTGVAGFIGSHLVERLLSLGQSVVGVDNFSTGRKWVLDELRNGPGGERFTFIEGDASDPAIAEQSCQGADVVLHQAGLGSVPRSLSNPFASHVANVDGFLRMALAARDAGVKRLVFASSSSVYGDHPGLPKQEDAIGRLLSPYAATKRVNEIYAGVLSRAYGLSIVGMRYFNVFGPRQDPAGPYAAVIPRWIEALMDGKPCTILGDGLTSRDFCFVENVVQANLLAAYATNEALGEDPIFNIACGDRTTLQQLHQWLVEDVESACGITTVPPLMGPFREGDVRHSLADVSRARERMGYEPAVSVREGVRRTVEWYATSRSARSPVTPLLP